MDVLILTYGCFVDNDDRAVAISSEHREAGLFARDEIDPLSMPDGYRRSIHGWFDRLQASRIADRAAASRWA